MRATPFPKDRRLRSGTEGHSREHHGISMVAHVPLLNPRASAPSLEGGPRTCLGPRSRHHQRIPLRHKNGPARAPHNVTTGPIGRLPALVSLDLVTPCHYRSRGHTGFRVVSESETLEQSAKGAVGRPVDLPPHRPFAIGGGSLAGGLDVAEVTGCAVELRSGRLSTSHGPLLTSDC
jgi:hypothetical protein